MVDVFSILAVFFGTAMMVALPIAVFFGVPLLAWNLRALIRLKEKELDLRRLEVVSRSTKDAIGELPLFVDPNDPNQLMAWARTHRELRTH